MTRPHDAQAGAGGINTRPRPPGRSRDRDAPHHFTMTHTVDQGGVA
jgi:hypothetical protein